MSDIQPEPEDDAKETSAIVPQEPVTVQLMYPIKFGETEITELTFRPLTAKEMRRTSANLQEILAQSTILDYAGYLSGKPKHIIDLLMAPDAIVVIGVVSDFFGASHATGPK